MCIYAFVHIIRNFLVYFLFYLLILFMNVLFSVVLLKQNLLNYSHTYSYSPDALFACVHESLSKPAAAVSCDNNF